MLKSLIKIAYTVVSTLKHSELSIFRVMMVFSTHVIRMRHDLPLMRMNAFDNADVVIRIQCGGDLAFVYIGPSTLEMNLFTHSYSFDKVIPVSHV